MDNKDLEDYRHISIVDKDIVLEITVLNIKMKTARDRFNRGEA